jgi:DNA-binding GntR family transcriptional regulator
MSQSATLAGLSLAGPQAKREYLVRHISDDILSGALLPGQRVSPETVGRRFGISHIPVREALGELEGLGYLRRIGNRGYFVPELSLDELLHVYEVREFLEEGAHRLAIPRLTPSDIRQMKRLLASMRTARRSDDWRAHSGYNREFHFVPIHATGNTKLVDLLSRLWYTSMRYQVPYFGEEGRASTVERHHRQLIDAYTSRDLALANQIMREHRAITLRTCRAQLL